MKKVCGKRPISRSVARDMTSQGNIYHCFKRREEKLISRLDRSNSSHKSNGWNFDKAGNVIYTCGG